MALDSKQAGELLAKAEQAKTLKNTYDLLLARSVAGELLARTEKATPIEQMNDLRARVEATGMVRRIDVNTGSVMSVKNKPMSPPVIHAIKGHNPAALDIKETQEIANAEKAKVIEQMNLLLYGGLYEYDDNKVKYAIAQGADVNIRSVMSVNNNPMSPPVISAIKGHNRSAVEILLNSGAKVNAVDTGTPVPAIIIAIKLGMLNVVQDFVLHGGDVNEFYGCTAFQESIICLSAYNLITNAKWKNPGIGNQLREWFNQSGKFITKDATAKGIIPFPEQPEALECSYDGALDVISYLLAKGAKVWVKDEVDTNVLDILNDPEKHKDVFYTAPGCECTPQKVVGEVLTLTVELKTRRSLGASVKVLVHYNLAKIKEKINAHLKAHPIHAKVDLKEFRDELNSKIEDNLKQAFDKRDPYIKRITRLQENKHKEAIYDLISRKLGIMLDAYRQISSGVFVRNKNTNADLVSGIVAFAGKLIPAPFSGAVEILSRIIDAVVEQQESKRFEQIAHFMPTDRPIQNFCNELACEVTEQLCEKLGDKNLSILAEKDIIDLSRLAFGIAIYQVYNIAGANLNANQTAKLRTEQLANKIISGVIEAKEMHELISTKLKAAPSTTDGILIALSKAQEKGREEFKEFTQKQIPTQKNTSLAKEHKTDCLVM